MSCNQPRAHRSPAAYPWPVVPHSLLSGQVQVALAARKAAAKEAEAQVKAQHEALERMDTGTRLQVR